MLHKSLKWLLSPIEDDTDSFIILDGGLLVVFLVDNDFLTLKNSAIVAKTNFQL